jgi:hypothetical protein
MKAVTLIWIVYQYGIDLSIIAETNIFKNMINVMKHGGRDGLYMYPNFELRKIWKEDQYLGKLGIGEILVIK